MRERLSSFLSAGERELRQGNFRGGGTWIGTRFWYYPDAIGIDTDLNNEYAVITNPRFTAEAERSREDFLSRDDFERMKKERLSPAIRESIDDLNANYLLYADAFPELQELCTVARLMGICSWLAKAKVNWLDMDDLLRVEVPACETEKEKTQLMAVTMTRGEGGPNAENTEVVFLSNILDQKVADYFLTAANVTVYLQGEKEQTSPPDPLSEAQAQSLFAKYRNHKVRDMVTTKEQVEKLVMYAANRLPNPKEAGLSAAKAALTAEERKLESLSAQIERAKSLMPTKENPDYNRWVDAYNISIDQYEAQRARTNAFVARFNNQAGMKTAMILEIGGGINLDPDNFAIRSVASSEKLDAFKRAVARSPAPKENRRTQTLVSSRDLPSVRIVETKKIGKTWISTSPSGSSSASSKSHAKADDGTAVWAMGV